MCMCVCVLLQDLVPAVDWMPYLTAVFAPVVLNESEPVVVYAKEYLQEVSDLISKTDKRSDGLGGVDGFTRFHVILPPPPASGDAHDNNVGFQLTQQLHDNEGGEEDGVHFRPKVSRR